MGGKLFRRYAELSQDTPTLLIVTFAGHTEAVEGATIALRETFLGWDGDRIQDIWQYAYRSRFYRGGPVLMVRSPPYPLASVLKPALSMTSVSTLWFRYCALGH